MSVAQRDNETTEIQEETYQKQGHQLVFLHV